MTNEYNEIEHKELYKKICNCKCSPIKEGDYCNDCKSAVLEFMKTHGAGVLCRDRQLENLNNELKSALCVNDNFKIKVDRKNKQIDLLKEKLEFAKKNYEGYDG